MPTHHRTCNLCEAHCGILIDVEGGSITSIRGDENDPLSRGYICPKAHALKDLHEDPDRIRTPMIREGETWREATWEEAVRTAAEGLHAVQKRHGRSAVAVYLGNPSVHNLPALLAVPGFIRALGTRTRFSASSIDQFPRMLAAYLVYGSQFAWPIPDLERTDHYLVLGANPLVSNGSLMTAPGMRRRIREIRQRGGKVIVVDPRRSETADAADEHVFVRPGTDSVLLLAMLSTIFNEREVNLGACEGIVDGLDHIRERVAPYTPEKAAEITGIAADVIRRLALEFADAPRAVAYPRIGTCVQTFGTLANYLADVLNIVTGRLDRAGGAMFTTPAAGGQPSRGHYGRWKSRTTGTPEFGGELPVATLASEIETEGEGQIRGMFTMAGNPVLSAPNGARIDRAMDDLEFMVSVDPCLNETTRHANVILPPRSSLENDQYSLTFLRFAVRNVSKVTRRVFEPAQNSRNDWEILGALTGALAECRARDGQGEDDPAAAVRAQYGFTPLQVVEGMISAGPYDISMDDLRDNPSGIDLGPLQEDQLAANLGYDDGRVQLAHDAIDAELDRLDQHIAADGFSAGEDGMLLIGRRQLRSNNSWMHNCPSLIKGRNRCTLIVHPDDAHRIGVTDGKLARVESRVGSVEVPVEVSDEVMRGVVSLPHGYGHHRPGIRQRLAAENAGVSMNDLTDDSVLEGMLGNGVLTGVPVRVTSA
jgi:anaerobic selenocysteine-containing dehydrogenase